MKIGVFICHCGSNIAGTVDCGKVAEIAKTYPDVAFSTDTMYTCSEPGQEEIVAAIKEHKLDGVVVASCTPRMHEPTFRRTVERAGLNKYMFEMANIREHVSWIGKDREANTNKAAELVRRGEPFALLKASTLRAQQEEQETEEPNRVRLTVGTPDSPRPGRTASVNGGAVKRAASLAGSFPAVVFDPGHLSLVKGAPEGRRKFLDAALCQLYPGYLTIYRRYIRALQQKNALLRRSVNGAARPYAEKRALLEVLNVELAQQGEAIQQRRRAYLAALSPLACANYEELSRGAETLSLRYAAQFEPGGLAQLLRQKMPEELRAGQSLCGPHREDLDLLLDGQPAKVYASQGQQRSVVLSLKMAEAAAAASITGEHPVMLLDDVLSELDEGRKQYLLTRMKEKQTFVTSCDDTAFLKTDGEVYRMNGGVLSKA